MAHEPLIAIVDDDESVRLALESLVKSLGHPVVTFAAAKAFLASPALDHAACLVTDVRMPGMSGIELQDTLLAQGRRLPLIFVTAHPQDRGRDLALAVGAVGYLGKPFSSADLVTCLDAALRRPGLRS